MRRLSSPMKAWPGVSMAPKVLMGKTTKRIRARIHNNTVTTIYGSHN